MEKLKKEIIISNSQFKEQCAQCGIIENINLDKITNFDIISHKNEYEEIYYKNAGIKKRKKREEDENVVIYKVKEEDKDQGGYVQIIGENKLGDDFLKTNQNKVQLWINGKEESNLTYKYKLKNGINKIKFIFKENIKSLNSLFKGCTSLYKISALKNWNVSEVTDFSYLFNGCTSLNNISSLKNWDVSKGINFNSLFEDCCSISDFSSLTDWNVSNGIYFNSLFNNCKLLSNVSALKNWNINNGRDFSYLFHNCSSLKDILDINNWKINS